MVNGKKAGSVRLYNVIFPIWLLWVLPVMWLFVLPANFLIDLLVLVLALRCLHVPNIRPIAKSVMLRVWLCGFAADFIGTAGMFSAGMIAFDYETAAGKWWYDNITNAVSYQPFESIYSFLWVTVCVLLSGVCIYFLNEKFCLRRAALDARTRKRVALALAVFTAPYLFYLPTAWFF